MKVSSWVGLSALAATLALAAVPAMARPYVNQGQSGQMQMSPADRANARVAQIDKAVGGLTDDQKTKIEAIYEKAYNDQATLRSQNADAETVRDVVEKADKDAKALLTPDQQAKFPSGRRRGGGGGGLK